MISVDSWRSRAVSAAVTGEDEEPEPILGVILTPAFAERTRISPSYEVVHVDLADPAGDLAGFQQAVRAAHPDASLSFLARRDREAVVAVATKPYVQSLRIFAVVLALTALLVLARPWLARRRPTGPMGPPWPLSASAPGRWPAWP